MSKLEAIVVTSPKELQVPEFQKKEIVGIVNEGIQAGTVVLPAAESGTKLYSHSCLCATSGPSKTVVFVTTSNVALDVSGIKSLLKDENYVSAIGLEKIEFGFMQYKIYKESLKRISAGTTILNIVQQGLTSFDSNFSSDSYEVTSVTDTITEL